MKKGIKVLIGFVLAIALAGSGFWLVHRFIESKEQQENFRELAESVLLEQSSPSPPLVESDGASSKPSSEETMSPTQPTTAPITAPEVLHDLGALKEKNAECAGWIRVPGTDIDYPFMWTPEDPEHYLRRDFYGNYSDYGVPFLDHRCDIASDNLKMTLDKLYIECVNEVKRTNGNFVLEDAFKWQKGSKWASKP